MSRILEDLRVSAPGKLFLSGEYAVLHGGAAVVAAVDRRAVARFTQKNHGSAMVEAALAGTRQYLTAQGLSTQPFEHLGVRVETSGFVQGGRKLGLGSSAAVCAAVCGLLFEAASLKIAEHREALFGVARDAHTRAQEGKGSGGDIAAAVYGGYIAYSQEQTPTPIEDLQLHYVAAWSGRSASTTELIGQVSRLAVHAPALFEQHIAVLKRLGQLLASAFEQGKGAEARALYEQYGAAMDALGKSAGAPIWTEQHHAIAQIARSHGGACKPSGAGGGDLALALFDGSENAERFQVDVRNAGFQPVPLQLGAPGLTVGPEKQQS